MRRQRRRPRPRRAPGSSEERAMMNVSSWSIRNPIPAVMLFVLLTFGGLPVLRRHEGAELPGHRPADGQRHRVAAGRGAGAAGNRRRAQDRELDRHAAGPQAHLHQGAGRRRHHHRGIPAGKAGAGSGRRRALGRIARAQRPAGRRARAHRHQDGPGEPAGAGLHRRIRRAWTKRRCPGSSTTTSRAGCWRCAASAPSTASAA